LKLNSKSPHQSLILHKQKIFEKTPKAQIQSLMPTVLPKTVLKDFISSYCEDYSQFFSFKRRAISDLAIFSLVDNLLQIGNRTPQNLLFNMKTGNVEMTNFNFTYNQNGLIQKFKETVPFRLTKNLETLFGPIQIDAIFNAVMTAAVLCVHNYRQKIKHQLAIFIRDDLISYNEQFPSAFVLPKEKKQFKDLIEKKRSLHTRFG